MTLSSSRRYATLFKLVVLAAALFLDRWLKALAVDGATAQLGPVSFVLFRNEGLVFSLPIQSVLGTAMMLAATVVVLVLVIRWLQKHQQLNLGLGLMLAGAASNLFDRFRYGFVIDWAYLGSWWPVFNVADVLVVVGLILYLRQRVR